MDRRGRGALDPGEAQVQLEGVAADAEAGGETGEAAPPPSRFLPILGALVAVALAVRWAYILVVDPVIAELSDATAYRLLAENLAEGRGYIRPYDFARDGVIHRTAEYPPVFPFLLSLAHRVGLDTVDQLRLFMAVFGSFTVGVIGLVGRRVGGDRVGLLAAGIAAVYPMLFQADAALMPETLVALGAALVTLAALHLWDRPGVGSAAALGLAAGFTVLTRAEAALLLPLLVGAFLLFRRDGPELSRRLVLSGVAVVCAVGVVGPWTIRNALVFDKVVPVSNDVGPIVRGANCDAAYQGELKGLWAMSAEPAGSSTDREDGCFGGFQLSPDHDESAEAGTLRTLGWRYAADHSDEVPAVMAVRWARTFGLYRPAQQTAYESLEGRDVDWQRFGTRLFYVLALAATAGAVVLGRRRPAHLWPLLAGIVAVSVAAMLTYGSQRFRAGAEPAVVVLAAVAVVAALDRWRTRRTGTPPPADDADAGPPADDGDVGPRADDADADADADAAGSETMESETARVD